MEVVSVFYIPCFVMDHVGVSSLSLNCLMVFDFIDRQVLSMSCSMVAAKNLSLAI